MAFTTLIVEDDPSFRKMVQIRLRRWREDIVFTEAKSIKEAHVVLGLGGTPFRLAVLDHNLPDGFGTDLASHPELRATAILSMSADESPELPGQTVRAGAQHFLQKHQLTEPLFIPLIEAILDRKQLENDLLEAKLRESRLETIQTLLATLRHEIHNPLGAVLGGTYLIRQTGELEKSQMEALALVEASSRRIQHVIEQLCKAAELEEVTKAREQVFQIPGDKAWE